ncbi:MAG: hypothetical protein ABID63_18235 [Pseudomonadota bacterium]
MSRSDLDPDLKGNLDSGVVSPVLLCRIGSADGDLRCWTGWGTLTWDGHDWVGIGDFGGVSEIEETTNIESTGPTYYMNGLGPDLLGYVQDVMGRGFPAELYVGAFANGALIGEPYPAQIGVTDQVEITDDGDSITAAVSTAGDLITLARARVRRYTDADQQAIHPGDRGFEFVEQLQDVEIDWGQV